MKTYRRVLLGLIVLTGCFAISASSQRKGHGAGASTSATVTISNFKFEPKNVTVKVGSVVTWEDKEGTHTVMADDGSFSSDNLNAGQTFEHKFTKAGKYPYYCTFHGGKGGEDMAGTVTVVR